MKRTIVIEIDDTGSPRLQRKADKELKRLVRTVADEMAWGDTSRELQDKDGNTVGSWSMTTAAAEAPSAP